MFHFVHENVCWKPLHEACPADQMLYYMAGRSHLKFLEIGNTPRRLLAELQDARPQALWERASWTVVGSDTTTAESGSAVTAGVGHCGTSTTAAGWGSTEPWMADAMVCVSG